MAQLLCVLCVGLIAVMFVLGTEGCDCSTSNVKQMVCKTSGRCTKKIVNNARELCFLRCKKKRTDSTQQQASPWQHTATRLEQQEPWIDVTELHSGDSQCLLDDIYHKLSPMWQGKMLQLLKQAAADPED